MGCFELHPFTVPRGMVVRDWKQDGSVGRVGLAPKHVNGSPNLSCEELLQLQTQPVMYNKIYTAEYNIYCLVFLFTGKVGVRKQFAGELFHIAK